MGVQLRMPAGRNSSQQRPHHRRRGAWLLLALAALFACAGGAPDPALLPPEAYLGIDGLPLLMPTNQTTDGREWFYDIPRAPVGLLVMLHRCGRNAEDFFPPSTVCQECIGMPEGVSIAKQGLARGYAVLAINSKDRRVGRLSRCWSWATDATAVRDIVKEFRRQHGLGRLPVFFTGCSSGGSLALRLARLMQIDGIMAVAIGLDESAFPLSDRQLMGKFEYPPTVFVHFERDSNTDGKIQAMRAVMDREGVPFAESRVVSFAIDPEYFSRRDDMISVPVSKALHAAFSGFLDDGNFIVDTWSAAEQPPPWNAILSEQLDGILKAHKDAQLALKNSTMLALAQRALAAAGEQQLVIQEVSSASLDAAADNQTNSEDANPNFSNSDGESSSSGGEDPYLSAMLLSSHIKEELDVAWAEHTNLGDYATATLIWLERCGKVNFSELAAEHVAKTPAALSPVRTAPARQTLAAFRACKSGAAPAAASSAPAAASTAEPPPPAVEAAAPAPSPPTESVDSIASNPPPSPAAQVTTASTPSPANGAGSRACSSAVALLAALAVAAAALM